jgi:hypothetical protein
VPHIPLTGGIDALERLLERQMTLNTEQAGRFIFDPGHTMGVHYPPIDTETNGTSPRAGGRSQ